MNKKLSVWQQEDYVDDSGYDVVESDDGSYFEVINRNTEEILLTDPIRNEAIKRAYTELVGETPQDEAQAPAPVDSLAAKNERIAELERENERMKAALLAIREIVDGAKPADYPVFSIVSDINVVLYELEQAPHAAPDAAVTLSESDIETLAKHQDSHNKYFYFEIGSEMDEDLALKLEQDFTTLWKKCCFGLAEPFNTEANRAAIAAKRAELDAPKSQEEYNRNRPYIA